MAKDGLLRTIRCRAPVTRRTVAAYGTILVYLEHSEVVDLLPERSAESLAAWFAQHPEIEFISRDRHGLYADGARRGAPQAQQVADRSHLVVNLTATVEQELACHRPFLSIPKPVGTSTAPLKTVLPVMEW